MGEKPSRLSHNPTNVDPTTRLRSFPWPMVEFGVWVRFAPGVLGKQLQGHVAVRQPGTHPSPKNGDHEDSSPWEKSCCLLYKTSPSKLYSLLLRHHTVANLC